MGNQRHWCSNPPACSSRVAARRFAAAVCGCVLTESSNSHCTLRSVLCISGTASIACCFTLRHSCISTCIASSVAGSSELERSTKLLLQECSVEPEFARTASQHARPAEKGASDAQQKVSASLGGDRCRTPETFLLHF